MSIREIEFATYGTTNIDPITLVFTLACGISLLVIPRRSCGTPLALVAGLIPNAERLVVFSLDFSMLRIVLLFGIMRFLFKPADAKIEFNLLDRLIVFWAAIGSIIYVAGSGISGAIVYKLGHCFELLGIYFLARLLIKDLTDAQILVSKFALVTILIAIGVLFELATQYNIFSILGGVPELSLIHI